MPDDAVPPPPPPLAEDPEPLIGPVVYLPVPVPPFGTGTANGDEGFATGLGVVGGFNEGLAVGGAGFACSAFLGPAAAGAGFLTGADVCWFCCVTCFTIFCNGF